MRTETLPWSPSARRVCRPSWSLLCWPPRCSATGQRSPTPWSWGRWPWSAVSPLGSTLRSCTPQRCTTREYLEFETPPSTLSPTFESAHLQSGGVAAEVGGVDEAEAKDADAAAVEGSDVTQSTVLQVCQLDWLAFHRVRTRTTGYFSTSKGR